MNSNIKRCCVLPSCNNLDIWTVYKRQIKMMISLQETVVDFRIGFSHVHLILCAGDPIINIWLLRKDGGKVSKFRCESSKSWHMSFSKCQVPCSTFQELASLFTIVSLIIFLIACLSCCCLAATVGLLSAFSIDFYR